MKIVTLTRITLDRNQDKRKFNELMADGEWVVYESIRKDGYELITFEKISELIVV